VEDPKVREEEWKRSEVLIKLQFQNVASPGRLKHRWEDNNGIGLKQMERRVIVCIY
jgi:hypothetical protein